MARALAAALTLSVTASVAAAQKKTPRRAEEPFLVFVSVTPDEQEEFPEQLREAGVELKKRLGKKDKWFRLAESADDAEIVVDLRNYWTRTERRWLSTWGVVPPTEGGQPDKTQTIEIVTYHSIRAQVGLLGAQRSVEASKKKNDNGRAKDAAKNFASELERIVKDEYWELQTRREAVLQSP